MRKRLPIILIWLSALVFCGVVLSWMARRLNPHFPRSGQAWTNSLGMIFVPVKGTKVLCCVWPARVQDFEAFADATKYVSGTGIETFFSRAQVRPACQDCT